MKTIERYYYRDYANPDNNAIFSSMVQIEKLSGVSARRIAKGIEGGHMFMDPNGRFFVDRVPVVKNDSKVRKDNLKV